MATSTYIIKQFGIVSVGKFFAVFGACMGFLEGILVAAGPGAMGSVLGSHARGIEAGFAGLVIMVILGGIGGFIAGSIVAVIYNIVLEAMGGVELDLEAKP